MVTASVFMVSVMMLPATAGTEFQINTYTNGDQKSPMVSGFADGGFIVTWTSDGQDGSGLGVYGQRFDGAGSALGSEFPINNYTNGQQENPAVASLGDGRVVVTWNSSGQDGGQYGVYGQILSTSKARLDVTLSTLGQDALQAAEGFGGIAATDRTADKIDIGLGFLRDSVGNIGVGPAATLSNGEITLADEVAPTLIAFNASPNSGDKKVGDEIVLTATASEDMRAGTSIDVTLNSGAVVTLTRDSSTTSIFTGIYTVAADDADTSDLTVASYATGTAVDLSGNALVSGTNIASFADLGSIQIDNTPPVAGLDTSGHGYDVSTGILTLAGTGFSSIDGNNLDWTKFSWDIDGTGSGSVEFQANYISSLTVTSDTQIDATLSADGQNALLSAPNFGGTPNTNGTADKIDVAAGFLRDTAGNASVEATAVLSNGSVTLADETAPTLIGLSATPNSGSKIIGDEIVISATFSENMRAGTSIEVTLNSGAVVTLTRSASNATEYTGTYTVSANDSDVSALSVASYGVGGAVDLSGNGLSSSTDISGFANLGSISLHTTPPATGLSSTGHGYDVSTGVLTIQGTGLSNIDKDNLDWSKFSWDVDGMAQILCFSRQLHC